MNADELVIANNDKTMRMAERFIAKIEKVKRDAKVVVAKLGKARLVTELAVAKKELELEGKIEDLASEIIVVNKELSHQILERNKAALKLEEKVDEIKWVNQLITERESRVMRSKERD